MKEVSVDPPNDGTLKTFIIAIIIMKLDLLHEEGGDWEP